MFEINVENKDEQYLQLDGATIYIQEPQVLCDGRYIQLNRVMQIRQPDIESNESIVDIEEPDGYVSAVFKINLTRAEYNELLVFVYRLHKCPSS